MEQKFKYSQKLTQTFQLSFTMKKSLDILKMNQAELLENIQDFADNNPIIDYTPSTDMHQFLMETASTQTTLKDDLYLQLHTTNQKYCNKIAEFIIESLDENGFFNMDTNYIEQVLSCSQKEFDETLSCIQNFEPIGVAAKSSIDAIAIQLRKQYLFDAEYILMHEQDALAKGKVTEIAKHMNISIDEVYAYIEDIKSCDPFPCKKYNTKTEIPVIPDFEVKVTDQEIEIIPKQLGHICIEDELDILQKSKELKPYFDEAYYFIDSISKRNKTLMILANELIHKQKNYFLYHDELQPCTLYDIAKICGFHESTVSRTLSNKYYVFQNEIYPVKNLFVSATKNGSSKDSILKAIKQIIDEENKTMPYTDFELVSILEEMELYVSRRAIAKYRTQLRIPSSKERKKCD